MNCHSTFYPFSFAHSGYAAGLWAFSTKAKITIDDLMGGQQYYFKGASFACDGTINWSLARKYVMQ